MVALCASCAGQAKEQVRAAAIGPPKPVVVLATWYNPPPAIAEDPAQLALYEDGRLICRASCGWHSVFSRFHSTRLSSSELHSILQFLNGPEVNAAAGRFGDMLQPDLGITKLGWLGEDGWKFTGLYGADAYEGGPDCGRPPAPGKPFEPSPASIPMVKAVRFLDRLCMRAVTDWAPEQFVTHFSPSAAPVGVNHEVLEIPWPSTLPRPPNNGCVTEDLVMDGRYLATIENLVSVMGSHRARYELRIDDCRFRIGVTVRLPGEDQWLTGEMLPW
jgi:hypothetical protein